MKTLFMIGADQWPGVSKVIEEMGELGQVLGKLMGTQGAVDHWDGSNLKEKATEEAADVLAAVTFFVQMNLDVFAVQDRVEDKVALFKRWHNEVQEKLKSGEIKQVSDYVDRKTWFDIVPQSHASVYPTEDSAFKADQRARKALDLTGYDSGVTNSREGFRIIIRDSKNKQEIGWLREEEVEP